MILLDASAARSIAASRYLQNRTAEAREALVACLDQAGLLDGRNVETVRETDGGRDVLVTLDDGTQLIVDPYIGRVLV